MKICEEKALELAKEFAEAEYDGSEWPLNTDDCDIKLCKGGFGESYLGMSHEHWSVIISTHSNDPNVAVMDPDHVIVLVDSESGKAKWFPIM
jgi:hypothetical protein